ncbi:MAG TPA: hypothetical protein VHG08_13285, partial [Longimicrobium sp.]|nr:hypothetical protein [Longimicrobium sp.]
DERLELRVSGRDGGGRQAHAPNVNWTGVLARPAAALQHQLGQSQAQDNKLRGDSQPHSEADAVRAGGLCEFPAATSVAPARTRRFPVQIRKGHRRNDYALSAFADTTA